jgi:O-antigen ligase
MFTLLNILVFFLLTGYAFKLLISAPSYVKLSKTEKVLLSGREKFLLLTLLTGMIETGVSLGGINLSALRLMVWIGFVLYAFMFYKPPKFSSIYFFYLAFLVWMAASLFWADSIGYGLRNYLKYLYPFLIMLFAMTFVKSPEFIYIAMRRMLIVAFILSIFLGGMMTNVLKIWYFYGDGLFWPMSTLADFLGIMSGVSFVMWWRTGEKKYLLLIAWFFLSSVLQSVRTGLLAIFLVLMFASYFRYKALSFPYIAGLLFVAAASVVFIPQVHDKMFRASAKVTSINDLSSVSTDNIDSNARFAMWDWALKKFYDGHEATGSGLGTVQHYMYDHYVWGGLTELHNDYVQILSDVGLIGLVLYALFPISIFLYAWRFIMSRHLSGSKVSWLLAILAFISALTTMMTDNVVNYSFAVHSYPFMLIGIAVAYKKIEKEQKALHHV